MIILFGKYTGKDISELDSGYLLWLIESYEAADRTLVDACKSELSERLKLDWLPPEPDTEIIIQLRREVDKLTREKQHLFDVIGMSTMMGANQIILEGYLNNRALLLYDLKTISAL